MSNQSTLYKVLAFVGFLVVASFLLKIVLGLAGSLIWLVFKIGIPVAIVYFILRWLSNRNTSRRY
ncbi:MULTISPECIES: hypothetical protein [Enterococcus]|uniref:hypothetical protein n=1 Tax=Enterococcus TaxID=1350 RepID=UPI00065E13D0|nr:MULTISPECIES: hypothetical protein [Enterococcus]KAF1302620.1 hypothetical protein BAU16_06140 [Enterococcus sp. JM9B]